MPESHSGISSGLLETGFQLLVKLSSLRLILDSTKNALSGVIGNPTQDETEKTLFLLPAHFIGSVGSHLMLRAREFSLERRALQVIISK